MVKDLWHSLAEARLLRQELVWLHDHGRFSPSRIGQRAGRQQAAGVRSDEVCWFDVDAADDDSSGRLGVRPGPAVTVFLAQMVLLQSRLNSSCFLSLAELECHAACYQAGASYAAHTDAFATDSRRVISFCHYLNEDWQEQDGGCLRLHGDSTVDVAPLSGRLVLFQSRTMLHEVLPVARQRFSLTGWMSARSA